MLFSKLLHVSLYSYLPLFILDYCIRINVLFCLLSYLQHIYPQYIQPQY